MNDVLTEDQVRDWIGADRLARLKDGGWLQESYSFEGFEGQPAYQTWYVRLRYQEDKRRHPAARRPATVTKAYRGVPNVERTRDGQQRVVFREPGQLSPPVKAELANLVALARRVLNRRR
jgi:hypothetical protein